jgi:hypothetical protein
MSAHSPKVDDVKTDEARLREGAVAKAQLEQKIAEAKKELEKMSTQLECWEQATRVNKATPMALVSSSEVETSSVRTGPISAIPAQAPASARMIASNPAEFPQADACGKEAVHALKPPPGFEYHSQQIQDGKPSTATDERIPHVSYVGAYRPASPQNRVHILLEESEKNKRIALEMKAEGAAVNKRLLEKARAAESSKWSDGSIGERGTDAWKSEETLLEVQRIREAMRRGCHFLSTDQEARIKDASIESAACVRTYIDIANHHAKQLCQENAAEELTLLVAAVEETVQDQIKSLVSKEKEPVTIRCGNSTETMSTNARADRSASKGTWVQLRRPPPSCGRTVRLPDPIIHQHRYIADLSAILRQAVEMRNERQIRSYKHTLSEAMVRSKKAIIRTAQTQRWDPGLVTYLVEDTDEFTSELIKNANTTLEHLNRENLTKWADSCAEQGGRIMNLTFEAYELLTPNAWTLEDCDEYMIELDEELKRLKDLFKLFSTDRLNLAMRREAAKLANNVNTEVTKARKIVQRLIAIHEDGVTSEEDQEEETSRPVMGTIGEPVDVSDGSGRYVRLPQEERDDGDTEDEEEQRDQGSSGRAASPRRNRPSGGQNFRGYQPGDAEPSPVLQGVVNCLTSISNQMLRMSGKAGKNGGWPWFDGTYREYPAFKRKWQDYEKNHLSLIAQQERVHLLREKCMSKEIGNYIKMKGSMPEAWERLDMLYDDPLIFTRELVREVLRYSKIQDPEYEKLFNYYCTVEQVIKEADKAGVKKTFFFFSNIDEMTCPLPPREAELWRAAKARTQPENLGQIFVDFVRERVEWSANQSQGMRKKLPKSIPPPTSVARSENEWRKAPKGKRNAEQTPPHKSIRKEPPRPGQQPAQGKAGVQTQWKIKRDHDAPPPGPLRRSCAYEECRAEQAQEDQPAPVAQDSAGIMRVNPDKPVEGWPRFDGTCAGYPAFKREWKSKRRHLHQQISQEEALRILRKKCLGNPQAGLVGKAGSMSEAWALLDGVFGDPMADARRRIEEFEALPGVRAKKDQRELYALIQDVIDEAIRQESEDLLLTPVEIGVMLRPLPPRERDRWFTWRVNSAPGAIAGVFIAFIKDQRERANAQQGGERDRPVERVPVPAPGASTARWNGLQIKQEETPQVYNEPGETSKQTGKKPSRQQASGQPLQSATSQTPVGKRGRVECSQRQANGHTTTPFQTTHPPDEQRRDGLAD